MNYRNCHLDAGAAGKQLWFGIFDVSKKWGARSSKWKISTKESTLYGKKLERPATHKDDLRKWNRLILSTLAVIMFPRQSNASGIYDLEYLDRAADPAKESTLYDINVQVVIRCEWWGFWQQTKELYLSAFGARFI
jgi:thiosulfate dehydrogenase